VSFTTAGVETGRVLRASGVCNAPNALGGLVVVADDGGDGVRSAHACFNSMLDISCRQSSTTAALLAFDAARYGRNDSRVANLCDVPFSSNCDLDVQFLLNRACAGRRRCAIDVGVARFTDPCGYAEFLVVSYRCVPGTSSGMKSDIYHCLV